jgi:hypothetical protein
VDELMALVQDKEKKDLAAPKKEPPKIFELSPLLTAANASALSIPASRSVSLSKPTPLTVCPLKFGPRRRNASRD